MSWFVSEEIFQKLLREGVIQESQSEFAPEAAGQVSADMRDWGNSAPGSSSRPAPGAASAGGGGGGSKGRSRGGGGGGQSRSNKRVKAEPAEEDPEASKIKRLQSP